MQMQKVISYIVGIFKMIRDRIGRNTIIATFNLHVLF